MGQRFGYFLYSFVVMLNNSGIINTVLMSLGIIKKPIDLLYNNFAVIVGMIYMFLPFAVLPMYSSIEKLDPGLIEASKDLGAGPIKTFCKVTLPLTAPGIFCRSNSYIDPLYRILYGNGYARWRYLDDGW